MFGYSLPFIIAVIILGGTLLFILITAIAEEGSVSNRLILVGLVLCIVVLWLFSTVDHCPTGRSLTWQSLQLSFSSFLAFSCCF